MKNGHGSNSGIQGFRNFGIEGILFLLIYLFYPLIPQFGTNTGPYLFGETSVVVTGFIPADRGKNPGKSLNSSIINDLCTVEL